MQRSWAHAQVRRAYPEFVSELDMLTPEDVVWEPYSPEAVATRAPAGLSSHCSANASLWLTSAILVYDIAVEASGWICPAPRGGTSWRGESLDHICIYILIFIR